MSPKLAAALARRDREVATMIALRKAAAMVHTFADTTLFVTSGEQVLRRVSHSLRPGCKKAVRACAFRNAVARCWQRGDVAPIALLCDMQPGHRFQLQLHGSATSTVCPPGVVAADTGDTTAWGFSTVLSPDELTELAEEFDVWASWDPALELTMLFSTSPTLVELAIRCGAAEATSSAVRPRDDHRLN